jgi:peptide chain release factor 2
MAMQMLKARLYEQELRRREEAARSEHQAKSDIGWGHQIRSYVLHPYQMVKDLRTGIETSNTQAVLDGDLDPFIVAALAGGTGGARRKDGD